MVVELACFDELVEWHIGEGIEVSTQNHLTFSPNGLTPPHNIVYFCKHHHQLGQLYITSPGVEEQVGSGHTNGCSRLIRGLRGDWLKQ